LQQGKTFNQFSAIKEETWYPVTEIDISSSAWHILLTFFNNKTRRRIFVDFIDALSVFVEKRDNWKRKARAGNFAVSESCTGSRVMK